MNEFNIIQLFLFIMKSVSIVANPKRSAAKEKGGASFRASFTNINVNPQMMVTNSKPICARIFLFI